MMRKVIWDGEEIELSEQEYLTKFGPEPAAPSLPSVTERIYKASMFRKMTDAEYEAYLQIRAGFPPRLQAIFDAAEYLSSSDEFWPALVAAAEDAYGEQRAAELLSSTS
jgi:hypothetical protein